MPLVSPIRLGPRSPGLLRRVGMRTWVRQLGPTRVRITRESLSQLLDQARYWGSTCWTPGDGRYCLMRFWTLVSYRAYFLDQQRPLFRPNGRKSISFGAMSVVVIQAEHPRNLLLWSEDQCRSGITAGQLCARLAA
jgi:hypothetical protein